MYSIFLTKGKGQYFISYSLLSLFLLYFNTDAAYDLPCSGEDQLLEHAEGQTVACNGHCKFPFSSRAFLSFKFDHNAIMKILDLWEQQMCCGSSKSQRLVAFEWVSLWALPFSGVLKKCRKAMMFLRRWFSVQEREKKETWIWTVNAVL